MISRSDRVLGGLWGAVPVELVVGCCKSETRPLSERMVVADATIRDTAVLPATGVNNFINVEGGFYKKHLSPHLNDRLLQGGFLGFKDGHVEWRKFKVMRPRTVEGKVFWW